MREETSVMLLNLVKELEKYGFKAEIDFKNGKVVIID